jgi:hypothetical protein
MTAINPGSMEYWLGDTQPLDVLAPAGSNTGGIEYWLWDTQPIEVYTTAYPSDWSYIVQIDLDADNDWSSAGEDISDLMQTLHFNNGMRAPYDTIGSSKATLTLDNSDNRFSPEHASALSGFGIGATVRIQVAYSRQTTTLFKGRIDDIDPTAGKTTAKQCRVTALGWIDEQREQDITLALQINQRVDQIAGAMIAALGQYPAGYGSGDGYTNFETGVETIPYFADAVEDKQRVYEMLRKLAASEALGRFYTLRDGRLRFWDRRYLMKLYTSQATFTGGELMAFDYQWGKSIYNDVQVRYHPRKYESGSTYVLAKHEGGIQLHAGAKSAETITLRYTNDQNETISTSDPIDPTPNTDYTGNDKEDGSGDIDRTGIIVASAEHYANRSVWSVYTTKYLPTWLVSGFTQRGNDRITDRGQQDFSLANSTSIDNLKRRYPRSINLESLGDHAVARAVAHWTVGKFKDPQGEVQSVTFQPAKNSTLAAAAIDLTAGDRITLQEAETGVNADYFIVGEEWDAAPSSKNRTRVKWIVEPAAVHKCLLMSVSGFDAMNATEGRMGY